MRFGTGPRLRKIIDLFRPGGVKSFLKRKFEALPIRRPSARRRHL